MWYYCWIRGGYITCSAVKTLLRTSLSLCTVTNCNKWQVDTSLHCHYHVAYCAYLYLIQYLVFFCRYANQIEFILKTHREQAQRVGRWAWVSESITCLSACLPVCLSFCPSVCLSVCLSVYSPVCLSVCLPVCLSAHISPHPPRCLQRSWWGFEFCLNKRISVNQTRKRFTRKDFEKTRGLGR